MKRMFLVFAFVLIICVCGCSQKETIVVDFAELLSENQDLSLSVYYSREGLDYYTRAPLKGEYFTSAYEGGNPDVVRDYFDSTQLEEFSEHLKSFGNMGYTCLDEDNAYIDARLVYEFESEKNGKLLMVYLGVSETVCVNGKYVSVHDNITALELYEAVLPFITDENVRNDVEEYISFVEEFDSRIN